MPVTAGHPDKQRPAELMRRDEYQVLAKTVLTDGIEQTGVALTCGCPGRGAGCSMAGLIAGFSSLKLYSGAHRYSDMAAQLPAKRPFG